MRLTEIFYVNVYPTMRWNLCSSLNSFRVEILSCFVLLVIKFWIEQTMFVNTKLTIFTNYFIIISLTSLILLEWGIRRLDLWLNFVYNSALHVGLYLSCDAFRQCEKQFIANEQLNQLKVVSLSKQNKKFKRSNSSSQCENLPFAKFYVCKFYVCKILPLREFSKMFY